MPGLIGILFWFVVAIAAFHAAYASVSASFLIVLYLFALLQLAQARHWRLAFYPGLAVGLLIAAFRLAFFWRLFSGAAIALWVVYAFWIGIFVLFARLCLTRLGPKWGWLAIPFVWTALEYFRSELYYLRFSWLNPGYAFSGAPWQGALSLTGVYGLGFVLMSVAAGSGYLWQKSKTRSLVALGVGMVLICVGGAWNRGSVPVVGRVRVAGVQMEFPSQEEVLDKLNGLVRVYPNAELLVLSEYTLDGPVPQAIRNWCRRNARYLVVGGKEPGSGRSFHNTAFVVGPKGDIVFRQVKAVPIQFFDDGLPAAEQKVWESPWGRMGICICYDLSYTRVTDRLVELGAEAILVPTMDMAEWGTAQHEMHARIAPARATEYGLPIFRLASSGISQLVDRAGHTAAAAPCPGDGAMLAGVLELRGGGSRPPDRWLAPISVGLTAILLTGFLIRRPRIAENPNAALAASGVEAPGDPPSAKAAPSPSNLGSPSPTHSLPSLG